MRSGKVQILLKAIVLLLLFSSIVIPQEYSRTYGLTLKARLIKQTDANSNVQYFQPVDNFAFGLHRLTTNSPEQIYRSIYEVDLPVDLPVGACIGKVELVYQNIDDHYWDKFALYKISIPSYDDAWDLSKKWEITESGSLFEQLEIGSDNPITKDLYLAEMVRDALESGKSKLYFGFRAYPEDGPDDTYFNGFVSVSLKYTYQIIVSHTLNNSSHFGEINASINNGSFCKVPSGGLLKAPAGSTIHLRATEEQFDGVYYWIWNQDPNTLEISKSTWTDENNELASLNKEFSYITNENEIYKTFTAQLKRKFLINRTDQTEFDGSFQTNDVARVIEGNSANIPYPETLTKTTGAYNFAGWESGGSSLKTPVDNTTYTALYKMPQKSNTQTAFSNSSQRKFIMTPQASHPYGGDLHMVYESMGKIWYERSTDGGTTWTIENGGKPLNTDYVYTTGMQFTGTGSYTMAKHPSIDYYQDKAVIVWQEQSGSNYLVRICFMQNGVHIGPANCIPFTSYGLYSEDIWPQIAVKDGGNAVIAIRRNDAYMKGLEVHYMTLYPEGGMAQQETAGFITGTNENTGSFTLATDRSATDKFHIAWQQIASSSSSSMQYAKLNFTYQPGGEIYSPANSGSSEDASALLLPPPEGQWNMNILKTVNVSNATSYTKSFSPSMIGVNDGSARLAFKGFIRSYMSNGIYYVSSCGPDNLSWIPYLNKYGGELFSPQISLGSEVYFVGWTQVTGGVYRTVVTDALTLRNMETLDGTSGRDMQINNGGTRLQQFAIGFNSESVSLPYSFLRSTSAIGNIQVNKKAPVLSGRGVFLTKGESQVYFILGNIISEGMNIDFIKSQDSVSLDGDLKKVNSFMTTEPFSMKESSSLTFAVNYGFKDSLASVSLMKDKEAASFSVELVDDASGRVIGKYLDEKLDKNNIFTLKESSFKVNSDGIGSRLVRLRLSVNENMKSQYTISDMFMGDGMLLSKSLKEMGINGSLEVKEYSLSQNYPNPFNPVTLISYTLPRAGKVSLRVYDILGKEVAALVNGFEEMGKYSVEFNASTLPSGIYIYELRANDFVKSGKMMLLK